MLNYMFAFTKPINFSKVFNHIKRSLLLINSTFQMMKQMQISDWFNHNYKSSNHLLFSKRSQGILSLDHIWANIFNLKIQIVLNWNISQLKDKLISLFRMMKKIIKLEEIHKMLWIGNRMLLDNLKAMTLTAIWHLLWMMN